MPKQQRYYGATVFARKDGPAAPILTHHGQCRIVAKCPSMASFMRLGVEHGITICRDMISETGNRTEIALVDAHGPILRPLNAWHPEPFVPLSQLPRSTGG